MSETTPILRQKDDLEDRIERYYLDNGKLTNEERKISERLELAFALLSHHKVKKIAITKYLATQKAKGDEISLVTAYNDMKLAEKIFVPLQKYSKEFLRLMVIESAQNDIKRLESKIATCKDNKLYISLMAQKDRCRETIIKAGGLMLNDANIPDFSKVQPPDIQINLPPQTISILTKMLKAGVFDTTELRTDFDEAEIVSE
jgi:hypothetical protein